MITILTPTYNRCHTLNNAYQSLLNQTSNSFEWLIIDDGSTDNTKELINKFIKEKKIKIRYYYKDNGGKHSALNFGIDKSLGSYTIILDSDDTLTKDAISIIEKYIKKYKDNSKICSFSFLRMTKDKKIISKPFDLETISNHIDFRYNENRTADMIEVFKTDILKQYKFPIFNNELFLSEAIVWNTMALFYDTVYIPKAISICEYRPDGLSKNFFCLVYNSPVGALNNSNIFLISRFKLSIRIKNAILYDGYSLVAKIKFKDIIKNSNNKLLSILFIPLGYIYKLFLIQKNKN